MRFFSILLYVYKGTTDRVNSLQANPLFHRVGIKFLFYYQHSQLVFQFVMKGDKDRGVTCCHRNTYNEKQDCYLTSPN